MHRFVLILVFTFAFLPQTAFTVQPDEILKDEALEARARHLSSEVRCPVCQNQSIDDSEAPIARDLRLLIRERLVAGDTDREVLDFLVARYGNFVLLKPPLQVSTLLLWTLTPLALMAGLASVIVLARRRSTKRLPTTGLTAEEQARIQALLKEHSP